VPLRFCTAEITTPKAIISTIKTGTIKPDAYILRVYQPTNSPLETTVSLRNFLPGTDTNSRISVRKVTALETDIPGEKELPVHNDSVTFEATFALTTLQVEYISDK
jgi:alpha-mannosidase